MDKKNACQQARGFAGRYIAFAEKLSLGAGRLASYLLVPLVAVFLYEIVARNIFNRPTTWAYGTCYIIGGCAAVLGFAYALSAGAMVRIDVLSSRLPEKTRCVLELILFLLVFLPLMLGACYECILNAVSSVASQEILSTGSWNAPIWPTKIAIAVSVLLLTMQGLAETLKAVLRLAELKKGGEKA